MHRCVNCGADLGNALCRIEITEVALRSTARYLRYMACNKDCLATWLVG